ncbi:MAG: sel1 repeat family protein [Variibacter sp.]|nr:sel1 repeat family protein [Variibacter sp.]
MRTCDRITIVTAIIAGLAGGPALALDPPPPAASVSAPALALDGTPAPANAPALTPFEAFRSGARALRAGDTAKGITALEYAAEKGHAAAQWKLGRIYAEGDGVARNDLRAFQYFSRVANAHADDNPESPQSRYVANAFVALGNYYLGGIPNSPIKPDPNRAREMFAYAASYFGDPDAQYYLARMYLEGKGTAKDPRQAIRWLGLAAHKGQYQAQALLGHILFKGEHVARQAARGLMWLTLARDSAGPDEKWISDLYDAAFRLATDDERALALVYLERFLKERRD